MKAQELLKNFKELSLSKTDENFSLGYIESDSRKLNKSDIFCVYDDLINKFNEYQENALSNGCRAIIINEKFKDKLKDDFNIIFTTKSDPRVLHGRIASFLLGNPSKKLSVIAVTGTNGKTSITHLLYDVFTMLGKKCGIIGTISIRFGNKIINAENTTPEPSYLQKILKEMLDHGIQYVFMEASSHGLKLHRMDGTELSGGIFSNLTPDHQDFHPSMEDYLLSKARLFDLIEQSTIKSRFGIVSKDSIGGQDMFDVLEKKSFSYPIIYVGNENDFKIQNIVISIQGSKFDLYYREEKYSYQTILLGKFNCYNLSLSILATHLALDKLKLDSLIPVIKEIKPVQGRFEVINRNDRIGIVDYAHTPDAMENILSSLKEIPYSKLITVFGCGGDRDKKKRPVMAQVASKYSDFLIITSDNPRTEDPKSVLTDVESGVPKSYTSYEVIEDRRKAIQRGIELLPANGILLVAGKGHEDYQILGKTKIHFSDKEEIENFLGAN
ncbi:MAG: UDP-N-acetylmuramoyl-L-alanyl-D-glutamate--2,6-diaminopimelate ligase [Leptospiraceae bacterium]|nr:UDP-N-acetylmuramoyl-L-alanyl-D-glutamate--2,6-diaminopimelate ligase [Leptospiraceae bacterium]